MKTGNGKIANLPPHIQDQLNYRLAEGDEGIELVQWLNSQPEVVKVIEERFDGTPISEQNLSEWRKRGYQKWLAYHEIIDETNALSDNAEGIVKTGIDCDKLLLTLTAAYAAMIQNWIVTPGKQMTYKLAVYKNLTNGVLALQRAELQKVRLEIARERLEILREKRSHKSPSSSGASSETASSPESAPSPKQSPAIAESSPKAEVPPLPDGSPISQNIPSSPLVPAPAPPTAAPQSTSGAQPSVRRPNVPPNAPPGTVISLNPVRIVPMRTTRPAPLPAPSTATQTNSYNPLAAPKSSAPRITPARPIPHR